MRDMVGGARDRPPWWFLSGITTYLGSQPPRKRRSEGIFNLEKKVALS